MTLDERVAVLKKKYPGLVIDARDLGRGFARMGVKKKLIREIK